MQVANHIDLIALFSLIDNVIIWPWVISVYLIMISEFISIIVLMPEACDRDLFYEIASHANYNMHAQ